MRSFISSFAGRIMSQVVIAALVLPSITFSALSTKAAAQTVSQPIWAVVDFDNKKSAGTKFGETAAAAVSAALLKTNRYDVQSKETVARAVETLGLVQPIPNVTSLLRVGAELRAQTIIKGEVVNYKVESSSAGKLARVSMRVICYDVASGLPVNGAAVSAASTIRAGAISDETLINDAIGAAASSAVGRIETQTLPEATVTSTTTDIAYINNGTRTGFKKGMSVIVTRGRRQVAAAEVVESGPTSATLRISRSDLGINPGDKVRAIFDVPLIDAPFNKNGEVTVVKTRRPGNAAGVISAVLVVALLAFILTGQNGSSQEVLEDVRAEAVDDPTNGSAVQISWSPNIFAKSNFQRIAWQIYRNDNVSVPARVAEGTLTGFLDTTTRATTVTFTNFGTVGGLSCTNTSFANQSGTNSALVPGRPYQYQVELVYGLNHLDLPGSGSSSGTTASSTGTTAGNTTGTTSGNTTGGNTTGNTTGLTTGGTTGTTTGTTTAGTTGSTATNTGGGVGTTGSTSGGTGGTGASLCYFVTAKTPSVGYATPLTRSTLIAPAANATLQTAQTFSFGSVVNGASRFTAEYILQVSSSPTFANGTVLKRVLFQRNDTGTLATDPVDFAGADIPDFIKNARTLYWRIGAKNVADNPGPVPDTYTRERYIFSIPNRLVQPGTPPPPPAN